MFLYKIERTTHLDYDQCAGAVVVANSPEEAAKIDPLKELEETRSFEDVKLLNSEISKAFLNQQEYVEYESWRSIRVIEK